MRPAPLRRILLIQAIERSDAESEVLPSSVRDDATREAARSLTRESGNSEQRRFFQERAEILSGFIETRFPQFRPFFEVSRKLRYAAIALWIGALVIGWFSQALGAEKLINILSFPLLGILAWNAAVYGFELIRVALRSRPTPSPGSEEPVASGILSNLSETGTPDAELPAPLRQGFSDFLRHWKRLTGPLLMRRSRAALHLAAALLAIAAVSGMYAKGAANEYRAYWESTFFSPISLQKLLDTIFSPASALSGIEVPDVAPLHRTAESPDVVGQNAAQWIHLYAITIGIFVLVPRLLLAALHGLTARRKQDAIDPARLPGSGLYFDRLLAEALGTALSTTAVSYCHQLSPTAEATLQREWERALGLPLKLDWLPPASLGEETEAARRIASGDAHELPAHLLLCFDLAATPEAETHGELIREVRKQLVETEQETQLHLCLDAQGFDEVRRNLPDFAERREERTDAWRAIAGPLRDRVTVFPEAGPA